MDTLNGTDGTALGVGEKDDLRGGADGDTFVLGETGLVYYGSGASDYAQIWDYELGMDTVQVAAGTYFLGGVSFLSGVNTGLYLDTDGSGGLNPTDELIGIFRNQDLTGVAVGLVVTQV
jgi:hypothetical protein